MINVIAAGFYTTIQDLGRIGYREFGIPVSGVMDSYSAKLANFLLGNHENDAVFELTFGGVRLQFEQNCMICITGADFSATIDGKKVDLNTPTFVEKESILSFGQRVFGVRTYIAVKGGLQTEIVYGSRSLYKGITQNSKIEKGMVFKIAVSRKHTKSFAGVKINSTHFSSTHLNCYKGPEFDWLSDKQQQQLTQMMFTITSENSRMGYRLGGIIKNELPSMLTSAVLPGTVQLTPSGTLVVLMRDCQVTGGYPRVLQLTESAINRLGQKTTNDDVSFFL